MTTMTYPIVGMKFRPPADTVVKTLRVKTPLTLMAEPMNPYDSNAIAVWVSLEHVNVAEVDRLTRGKDQSWWVGQHSLQLGYIPKEVAGHLRRKGFPTQHEINAEFYYTFGSNIPHVKFDFEPEENGK